MMIPGALVRRRATMLLLGLGGAALTGCSATIKCPEPKGETARVFLVDHGRHASLGISTREGRLVRYGYGDWRYYAETEKGFRSGARALLWPTKAAQARREYQIPSSEADAVADVVLVPIEEVHAFDVPAKAAQNLKERLDREFAQAAQDEHLVNDRADFEFAPHPERYWLGNSSNHKVADRFEELGCEVSGAVTFTVGFAVTCEPDAKHGTGAHCD